MTGGSYRYREGDLIRVSGGIFAGQLGVIIEDTDLTATFCWVFIDGEPQWVHSLDCEVCNDETP